MSSDRRGEAAAIFTTHGALDTVTTIGAARVAGVEAEANPIVRGLLELGELPTALIMLAAVTVCCLAWPTAADALDVSPWVGFGVALIGAVVAAVNLVVILA